jgi:hypothetical protein
MPGFMSIAGGFMRHLTCLFVLAPLMAGCATLPKADIVLIEKPADLDGKELDTYAFPRSVVNLGYGANNVGLSVTVTNKSYEAFRIGLRRNDDFGVRTNLNLTKVANSDMVDEAGVSVTDNRLKTIGDIGKLATSILMAASAADGGGLQIPDQFEAMDILSAYATRAGDSAAAPQDLPGRAKIQYWLGPVQPDARPIEPSAFGTLRNGLVYAACRELKLFVDNRRDPSTEAIVPISVYVSDPRYFRYVAFPQKGKVEVHTQCGTSVTSEKDDSIASDAAIGNAVLDELKKLKEAIDKKKEEDGSL